MVKKKNSVEIPTNRESGMAIDDLALLMKNDFNVLEGKLDKMGMEMALMNINFETKILERTRNLMTKSDKNDIMNALDRLTALYKDHDTELAANLAAHDRIQRMSTKSAPTPA